MKNKLFLTTLLLFAVYIIAWGQNNYYNSSQYRTQSAQHDYDVLKQQQDAYKPSYNYNSNTNNSNTPSNNNNSYNWDADVPKYNNYESNEEKGRKEKIPPSYFINSKVVFCEKVDDNGNPIGTYSDFTLSTSGGVVYTHIDNNYGEIKTKGLLVNIYKDNQFMEKIELDYNSSFRTLADKAWFTYDYSKFGAGYYQLEIYSLGGWAEIKKATVLIKKAITPPVNLTASTTLTADFYKNSTVLFGNEAKADATPVQSYKAFTLTPGNGNVKTFVRNEAGMKTKILSVNILKYENGTYRFKETKEYTFGNADNPNFWFNYDFSKFGVGEYRLDIYNGNGVRINSGDVNIKTQ